MRTRLRRWGRGPGSKAAGRRPIGDDRQPDVSPDPPVAAASTSTADGRAPGGGRVRRASAARARGCRGPAVSTGAWTRRRIGIRVTR
ncbi:hypothetical protein ISF6_3369 [Piscinibacter sakaiensis]|uniref:Uncharacterized protein n=1 Tax=Piscinibacter sakaiensis TaxID=1547922 RepID=A0A0K8P4Q9_PISS1|nr:hypothetical protein ISF6_3369 [Piscinibacter sakaiensis]